MRSRARLFVAAALALALAPAAAVPAGALAASKLAQSLDYSRVISVFDSDGGHLPPCAFTQAQLEAALAGIPQQVARTVPDFKRAVRAAIAAHERGDCKGVKPTGASQAAGIGAAGAPPETSTTPSTPTTPTTGATVPPAATAPGTATVPAPPAATAPATTVPAPATAPAQPVSSGGRDRTPLAIAAIAIGALLLGALALWALARARGWDSPRLARARHAWGEAGFRTTGTWAEFADWLRLGR